jgi:hypothetical protein
MHIHITGGPRQYAEQNLSRLMIYIGLQDRSRLLNELIGTHFKCAEGGTLLNAPLHHLQNLVRGARSSQKEALASPKFQIRGGDVHRNLCPAGQERKYSHSKGPVPPCCPVQPTKGQITARGLTQLESRPL